MFKRKSPANFTTEMSAVGLIEESGQALYRIPVFLSRPTPFNAAQTAFLARVIA